MAVASRRWFLADTAVIRLGTILPRSETKRCSSLTSLKSIFGALAPEKGQVLRRRKKGRRAPPRPPGAVVFIGPLLRPRAARARPRRAAGRGADGRHGHGRGSGRRARDRRLRGRGGGSAALPRDLPRARRRGPSDSAAHPR